MKKGKPTLNRSDRKSKFGTDREILRTGTIFFPPISPNQAIQPSVTRHSPIDQKRGTVDFFFE